MAHCHRQGNHLGLVLRDHKAFDTSAGPGYCSRFLRLPCDTYFTSMADVGYHYVMIKITRAQ